MPTVIEAGSSTRNYVEFPVLDENGDYLTGKEEDIDVFIMLDGVDAEGAGSVAETDFGGIYRYTLHGDENADAAAGLLRVECEGAITAHWPFMVVAGSVYGAPPTLEEIAETVRTDLESGEPIPINHTHTMGRQLSEDPPHTVDVD